MFREYAEAETSRDLAVMQSLDMKAWLKLKGWKLSGGANALWIMGIVCQCEFDITNFDKASV